ncbi:MULTISPECIES: pyridoxamine 5'-phosphate oxidase family protein [Arthrobacter]|uniref:Pyridoxamine 5'-phosphate oxidase n=1 Tax=Arthrobacter terricola TaxID=2547396 RepID=A0A4R5K8K6_9MICC|nr:MULTISPECIES: pyridoxamine 5'-phosphate oxidase family protein [Arthrobacter]MBT8163594.1 pyridoxamine 5'-phosphate oxidase family protein [Arthrobacter sp. GN70]TDF88535.1 pyridoxamine 5'-phosphate oxidase [Arthrobacter terricola]
MSSLTQEVFEFVARPNPAVMATVTTDGQPVTVQIVYLAEDPSHLLLSIAAGNSRGGRLEHLRHDPRLAITVVGKEDWTQAVSLKGTAVEFFEDANLAAIDMMSMHYFGAPYGKRDPRIAVRVRIDEWSAEIAGQGSAHRTVWSVADAGH